MIAEALADPVVSVFETAHRADLVAASVVLDDARGHAVDIGRVVVEVANERPDAIDGMIENGAVIGRDHGSLLRWAAIFMHRQITAATPDFWLGSKRSLDERKRHPGPASKR